MNNLLQMSTQPNLKNRMMINKSKPPKHIYCMYYFYVIQK